MNKFQQIICKTYGGGDYSHILKKPELWESEARKVGDTLFLFLMIELSDDEGEKMTGLVARRRLRTAMSDIDAVLNAVEKAHV